jgi:hypothetical protein
MGLWPFAYWDCGFVSRLGHGCLSVVSVVCCQLEVSATSWSLIQRSPTECGVSKSVIVKPWKMRRPRPQGAVEPLKKKLCPWEWLIHETYHSSKYVLVLLMERVCKCCFKMLDMFILYYFTVFFCMPILIKCVVFQDMIHVIKCWKWWSLCSPHDRSY